MHQVAWDGHLAGDSGKPNGERKGAGWRRQSLCNSNADKAAIQILHLRLHLSNVAELRCQFFPQLSLLDAR